jgi:hypothetical protein
MKLQHIPKLARKSTSYDPLLARKMFLSMPRTLQHNLSIESAVTYVTFKAPFSISMTMMPSFYSQLRQTLQSPVVACSQTRLQLNQTQKALLRNCNQKVNYNVLHIMLQKKKKEKETNAQEPEGKFSVENLTTSLTSTWQG